MMTRSAKKRLEEEARTRRTNRMLIGMVVIFGTCWFPINLINLLGDCLELGNLYNRITLSYKRMKA